MKISNETMVGLKYCATINGGIKIDEGNEIITCSDQKTSIARMVVEETFPSQFLTTDLSRFLQTASLIDDPVFEFEENNVVITSASGKQKTIFYYAKAELVNQLNRTPNMEKLTKALEFTVSDEDLNKVFKATNALNVQHITIYVEDGMVVMKANDNSSATKNTFSVAVGASSGESEDAFVFDKNNIKIPSGYDYKCVIYKEGLMQFTAIDSPYKELTIFVVANK